MDGRVEFGLAALPHPFIYLAPFPSDPSFLGSLRSRARSRAIKKATAGVRGILQRGRKIGEKFIPLLVSNILLLTMLLLVIIGSGIFNE